MAGDDQFMGGKIISKSPLITIGTAEIGEIFLVSLAKMLPEIFDVKFGLHLISCTWNVENGHAERMRGAIAEAKNALPGHEFVFLACNEVELYFLSGLGVTTILANPSIFEDESIWRPQPNPDGRPKFHDAIYNARFDEIKRHELATKIELLSLVYSWSLDESVVTKYPKMKALLPSAYFANHEFGDGNYILLSPSQVCAELNKAKVGLCLSPYEGHMRASIQYLLSGLPIVSTNSLGGRDRYYSGPYCAIANDDPDAVSHAVSQIIEQNFKPQQIRRHIGDIIEFERYNFLNSINRIAGKYFGSEIDISFDQFRGSLTQHKKIKHLANEYLPH